MPALFDLPAHLEAASPPEARGIARDQVRMLVSNSTKGEHALREFHELPQILVPGDLLVVNDSQTIPAAIDARIASLTFPVHFSTRLAEDLWIVEPRWNLPLPVGSNALLPGKAILTLLAPVSAAKARFWFARLVTFETSALAYLKRYARPVRYSYVQEDWPLEDYQTIFARNPGSVEMPSAGRPFTLRTLDGLQTRGIEIAPITLHCGLASPERPETPMAEWMRVSTDSAKKINHAKAHGKRVIAIGTTVVRALESAADGAQVSGYGGWTERIVDRDHPPQIVDGLLTGFHEPRASHLAMLESIAEPAFLSEAYALALRSELLWHEFGDVHLIV